MDYDVLEEMERPVHEAGVQLQAGRELKAVWRQNDELAVYASVRDKQTRHTPAFSAAKDTLLATVHVGHSLGERMAHFVSQSHLVFNEIQAHANDDPAVFKRPEKRIEFCQKYIATLTQQLEYLVGLKDNSVKDSIAHFHLIRAIFSLYENLYLSIIPNAPCSGTYLKWLAGSFSPALDGDFSHDGHLNALRANVLRGNKDEALKLLAGLKRGSGFASALKHALETMPAHGPERQGEFQRWQKDIKVPRTEPDRVGALLLCMTGDFSLIEKEADLQWFDHLAGLLNYQDRELQLNDLSVLLERENIARPENEYEQMLFAILEMNFLGAVRIASELDPWLAAHFTDLLVRFDHLDHNEAFTPDLPSPLLLREYVATSYGTLLMSSSSFWRTGADYLGHAGEDGHFALSELILRVPLPTEKSFIKVISVCELYNLAPHISETLHAIYARKCVDRGQLGSAVFHYGAAASLPRVNDVVKRLACDFLKNKDRAAYLLLIECLGDVYPDSDELAFLHDYLKFHRTYQDQRYDEASEVLSQLFSNQNTPQEFIATLLIDAVPLLEAQVPLFAVAQIYEMMTRLELLVTSHKKEKLLSDVSEAELEVVRYALVQGLARAVMSTGTTA